MLVLTDAVAQATVDSAVHALADHPAVAGPVVTLRVEWLEGEGRRRAAAPHHLEAKTGSSALPSSAISY